MVAFIFPLGSSFVINGFTTDSKKIYVIVSFILHHSFFFSDSLSSDNTACLRRVASKTRCTINGAIVRVDRKRVRLGSSRSPDPTRPDPKLPRFITPPQLSCPVPFCSVLLNEHLEKASDNNSNYIWALLIQICLTAWDILHHFIIFYLKISFGLACLA